MIRKKSKRTEVFDPKYLSQEQQSADERKTETQFEESPVLLIGKLDVDCESD